MENNPVKNNEDLMNLDIEKETDRIVGFIRETVIDKQRRKGVVIGLSGGIDSTVCAYLAVKALGSERVVGLKMPERESDPDSATLADLVIADLRIDHLTEDITLMLEGCGCYERRDDAIRSLVPGYAFGWRSKLVLPSVLSGERFNISRLVVRDPKGEETVLRPKYSQYFGIVAASNFKQRCRKMMEYYHADRLNYSVIGTPNRLEYQLGFFVKNGDGSADIKPIAHLYKTQVYNMAHHLNVPEEISRRTPTTDTYSLPQTQEEFYFSLPYDKMDLALFAYNNSFSVDEAAFHLGLTVEQVGLVYKDITSKINATRYLHMGPEVLDI